MRFERILNTVKVLKVYGEKPSEINYITDDSEKAVQGCLFISRKGNNKDGKDYIALAVSRGAVAVMGDEFVCSAPCFIEVDDVNAAMITVSYNFFFSEVKPPKLIGVVGTNGKTSVCHILSHLLSSAGYSTGIIGTIGVYYSGKRLNSELTTPGLIELCEIISKMQKDGVNAVVMEVSAHAIAQRRTGNLFFDALIFTNCSEDHLDYFETFEKYSSVKRSVFKSDRTDKMIVNADDPLGRKIIEEEGINVISYGIENPADAFAIVGKESDEGTEFILNLMDYVKRVKLKLVGEYNVYNALAALTCAAAIGVDAEIAAKAVEEVKPIAGRCEFLGRCRDGKIFLDYAHTPDGIFKSLTSLKKVCKGKLICLFGCGGNREKEKRPKMGEISVLNADFTVITDDNPRFEDPEEIRREIESGAISAGGKYINIAGREKAIEYAISLLNSGDVLLLAGKGAEDYQEICGVKYPFSDRAITEKIIDREEMK